MDADGQIPLDRAVECNNYPVASLIIHKILNQQNQDTIFDFITRTKQAIEFMLLSPINANLILKDNRVMRLVNEWEKHDTGPSIGFYKLSEANHSIFL